MFIFLTLLSMSAFDIILDFPFTSFIRYLLFLSITAQLSILTSCSVNFFNFNIFISNLNYNHLNYYRSPTRRGQAAAQTFFWLFTNTLFAWLDFLIFNTFRRFSLEPLWVLLTKMLILVYCYLEHWKRKFTFIFLSIVVVRLRLVRLHCYI